MLITILVVLGILIFFPGLRNFLVGLLALTFLYFLIFG